MKIGILTLSPGLNYGGVLQAYALQTVLERMGHEVCIIDKPRKPRKILWWKAPLTYGKRILMNLTGHSYPIFLEQKLKYERPIIRQNIDLFIEEYLKCKRIKKFSDLQEKDFDAIVVGSDQIWRPGYFNDRIENAYLEFARNWHIKRIAYAASFGTEKWEYSLKQEKNCKALVGKFNAVSVRELSGVDLCKTYFEIKAEWVLDPTMLLKKEDYIKIFRKVDTPQHSGTLLCYILDENEEKTTLIDKIEKEYQLKAFNVKCKTENYLAPVEERIQPSFEQWIRGFYDTKFVITDSFHACVFSILFNKPFIAYGNASRGMSRFVSLLSMFGLQNRLITNISEYKHLDAINWERVNSILEMKRKEAFNFLESLNSFS